MKPSRRRGALFTIDALIAGAVVLSVLMAVSALAEGAGHSGDSAAELLGYASLDIGQVLEEDGSLEALISGEPGMAQEFLDALRDGLCADVSLLDEDGAEVAHALKAGCEQPGSSTGQVFAGRRLVPAGDASYVAEVRAWYP